MKGMCEWTSAIHSGLAPYLRPCFTMAGSWGSQCRGVLSQHWTLPERRGCVTAGGRVFAPTRSPSLQLDERVL
jgi:hypothetical protein